MHKYVKSGDFDPKSKRIKRLSIIIQQDNGELIEVFADEKLSQNLWASMYIRCYLNLVDWTDQKIEIEKK